MNITRQVCARREVARRKVLRAQDLCACKKYARAGSCVREKLRACKSSARGKIVHVTRSRAREVCARMKCRSEQSCARGESCVRGESCAQKRVRARKYARAGSSRRTKLRTRNSCTQGELRARKVARAEKLRAETLRAREVKDVKNRVLPPSKSFSHHGGPFVGLLPTEKYRTIRRDHR